MQTRSGWVEVGKVTEDVGIRGIERVLSQKGRLSILESAMFMHRRGVTLVIRRR